MLNQLILVGRLKSIKDDCFTLAVNASYKDEKGEYDTYLIDIYMKGTVAENVKEYCSKGSIMGVKGHIESKNRLYADKVTFLSGPRK